MTETPAFVSTDGAFTDRDGLIVDHLPYVASIAVRYRTRRAPQEDLIAAGTIGLIQAADRFDPSRGLKFKTFAKHRIAGAIVDHLRGVGPAGTSLSSMTQGAADALQYAVAADATAADVSRAALALWRQQVLTPLENRVIAHCFDLDRPAAELAIEMKVTEGYVSHVKARALRKLRNANAGPTSAAALKIDAEPAFHD